VRRIPRRSCIPSSYRKSNTATSADRVSITLRSNSRPARSAVIETIPGSMAESLRRAGKPLGGELGGSASAEREPSRSVFGSARDA
jgi:hypothetical protein